MGVKIYCKSGKILSAVYSIVVIAFPQLLRSDYVPVIPFAYDVAFRYARYDKMMVQSAAPLSVARYAHYTGIGIGSAQAADIVVKVMICLVIGSGELIITIGCGNKIVVVGVIGIYKPYKVLFGFFTVVFCPFFRRAYLFGSGFQLEGTAFRYVIHFYFADRSRKGLFSVPCHLLYAVKVK